jgi:hypothetical protein
MRPHENMGWPVQWVTTCMPPLIRRYPTATRMAPALIAFSRDFHFMLGPE